MKKNDKILIISLLVISVLCFFVLLFFKSDDNLKASVYIQSELVFEVYLSDLEDPITKEFEGVEGIIIIEFSSEGVIVIEDSCTYHICSNQGLISNTFESIICVPNELYVKLSKANSNEVVIG